MLVLNPRDERALSLGSAALFHDGQVGRAIDQFPPPGTQLEPGETVTIVVGKKAAALPPEEEE